MGLGEAQNYVQNFRQLMRGVFTLTGNYQLFGEDWSWNAYAQNSSVRERQYAPYNTMNVQFNNAVDLVIVQASGPDSVTAAAAAALKAAKCGSPHGGQRRLSLIPDCDVLGVSPRMQPGKM